MRKVKSGRITQRAVFALSASIDFSHWVHDDQCRCRHHHFLAAITARATTNRRRSREGTEVGDRELSAEPCERSCTHERRETTHHRRRRGLCGDRRDPSKPGIGSVTDGYGTSVRGHLVSAPQTSRIITLEAITRRRPVSTESTVCSTGTRRIRGYVSRSIGSSAATGGTRTPVRRRTTVL